MNDTTTQTTDTTAAPPGGGDTSTTTQTALVKPDFLPADYWDDKAGIKTDEFAKHYGETTANAAKYAERIAGIPEKPEAYKVELKFPDDVKLPDGVTFDPSKDPRLPVLLKTAHEIGLTNADVNKLVALDAQFAIQHHTAETARLAEETKKLGDKANERLSAVSSWLKGRKERGDLDAEEYEDALEQAATAAGVRRLEKEMAARNGTVPGHVPTNPGKPEPQSQAQRWYGGPSSQQKAS